MNKQELIKADLAAESNKQGLLSFGNGIQNIVGARGTNKNIRLRLVNTGATDETVYLIPSRILGTPVYSKTIALNGAKDEIVETQVNGIEKFQLPKGKPFFVDSHTEAGSNLTVSSLNLGQDLEILGNELAEEATQITAISMKSFTAAGVPENTNYGNALTHYRMSHLEEPKRSTPLNFDAFQNSKDVSTEMLKIDFIKNNFNAIISQKDVLALQINAGTKMDVTLHLGGRLSMPEYFYRQVKAGATILQRHFPGESAVDCGC
ncbi:MAG TPA: hypothetical protein VKX31_00445 [Brumimicrobium sp.]|nr:hypothetical protein [Brumimicrobium sp.]